MAGAGRARRGARAAIVVSVLAVGLLGAAAGAWWGWRRAGPPDLSTWDAAIDVASRESGVDGSLLRALVAVESGGRPDARSAKGARGLLQVMPATARAEAERLGLGALDEDALYQPEVNLRVGASYLARLLARYGGDEAFALAAYNAGPTALNRWRKRLPHLASLEVVLREGYPETRVHVTRVLRWRQAYRD